MPARIKYPIVNGQKQCGECLEWKPLEAFQKTRKRYESKCRICRTRYAASYRQRPDVKAAQLAYTRAYRSVPQNRQRLNENTRRHRQKPEAKQKHNASRRIWAAREKRKSVEYKGGGCQVCGYSACLAALDFHHLDPNEKEGYGTGAIKSHWSFERSKSELDKCICVCVRCHREIHAGLHPQLLVTTGGRNGSNLGRM